MKFHLKETKDTIYIKDTKDDKLFSIGKDAVKAAKIMEKLKKFPNSTIFQIEKDKVNIIYK